MEKLLFRKLIADISFRALAIAFTIGLIVWIIQAVNYLDFVIDDGHNFKIYFLYNLYNFPKIIHRILPFVFAISIFFELIKYEKNNELLIFWTNGVSKQKFIKNLVSFTLIIMFIQVLIGSFISPNNQFKARLILKNSNMDFLPNLIKQGKFIDTISGLTIFINHKTDNNSFKNIYIQEGEFDDFKENDSQIIYAKEGFLINEDKKLFRLLNGKIISNNNNKLISFTFDKIDYDLSKFSSRSIKRPKIQEISSIKLIKCSISLMSGKKYIDDLFSCEMNKFKNFNQELYKRFIKPFYLPILTLVCCFLLTFSKEQHNYILKTIKIFIYVFLILVVSEIFMRYIQGSLIYLILFLGIPILFFLLLYNFLIKKVNNA
ncbi:LptF/LptG family permease [Candidatus Pelagibacter sp.]|uniref:LptF/LptG family permease n=1 Tax=Candidatus Pelagibacter sp. TaxID=2024849 RepID=UPI003F82AB65